MIFLRLFGGKPSKQAPVTTAENMKNSTIISNPHATLNHVAKVLESPDGGADTETSSPLFGGRVHVSGVGTLGSEQVSKTIKIIIIMETVFSLFFKCGEQMLYSLNF